MIAAFILVLSVAALVRFGIAQWRSVWMTIAEQPLSATLQVATGVAADAIGPDDFEKFARLCAEAEHSPGERNVWLKEVHLYYRFLRGLQSFASHNFPNLSSWTETELATCSRYVGVILDRRLNTNFAYAAASGRQF